MIINRRLVNRQLGASLVPSDAAEIAAHHALAVMIMFCVEVGRLGVLEGEGKGRGFFRIRISQAIDPRLFSCRMF